MDRTRANMPSALERFQDGFARALLGPAPNDPDLAALADQPGFAVYRNTVRKGCIDALQGNYPAVARLVGEEWFRAAAAIYTCANLPTDPTLLRYGEGFAPFLASFEPAAELPYLEGVARMDRFWTEAHAAPDEPVLDAASLGRYVAQQLPYLVLRPHASARWAWFDGQPIFTIWDRNRKAGPIDATDIEWRDEGALVWRPADSVRWMPVGQGGCAFLDACAEDATLADAAAAAQAADPGVDIEGMLAQLLAAGAFGNATLDNGSTGELQA